MSDKATTEKPMTGHALQSASLRAREAGEGRKLVVVARDQFDLWWQLCQALTTADGVEVVLDRRQGGRWQWAESQQRQERGRDRRHSPNGEGDLSGRAFLVFPRPALAS